MTPWAIVSPARLAGPRLLRTQSDERLVDLVRAGNDRAFEAIVLRYRRQLLRHCRRLLPASRAEDAVQQTLLRALEAMRADERKLKLGPWLHRIAHNTAIDCVRRMDSHWEELDERMDGVEPVHAAVERRARLRSVISDIDALPERQRRALVLRELEGRSYAEIADTLGSSGAAVRQLLNRARNAMRAAAGALLPPALAGRVAGSQAGVRIAEMMDPPGTALVAKATAAVAAGAVALVAVTGPPSGGGGAVPRAEAAPSQPAPALAAAAQGQPAKGRAAVGADDPRARRSTYRQRWEAPGDGREARRVAAAPDGARAGWGRLADGAPASGRPSDTIRAGAGGGQTGAGNQTLAGSGQTAAGGGQSVAGNDGAGLGVGDELDDDAADGGGTPDEGAAAGGAAATDGGAAPDYGGLDGGGGQLAGAGTGAPAAGHAEDGAPAPTARVPVSASPVSADGDIR